MTSNRRLPIIVGALFVAALVSSMLSGVFTGSMDDPDYLEAVSANENKVLIGVVFQLILTASVVAIPILLFPILREHHEVLALGYIVARIFEGFFDVVIALSQLLLLAMSRQFVQTAAPLAAQFDTSGALLLALRHWGSVPENFPYGLGALFLNFILLRSGLVPRWLSVWGLVGGALMLAMGLLRMFGLPVEFLALPIVLSELFLAARLIFIGFNSSARISGSVKQR